MEKDDNMDVARMTLVTLMIGIVLSCVVIGIVGFFLLWELSGFLPGVFVGMVTAEGMALCLYKTIDKCLDMESDHAMSYTRRMALLRFGLMGIPVTLSILWPEVLHPAGVMFGLLGLKFGAYLQPVLMKLFTTLKKRR